MIIAVIPIRNFSESKKWILDHQNAVDGFEFRLDFMKIFDLSIIALLKEIAKCPIIFTLRKKSQGGECILAEKDRLDLIQQLCTLSPEYLDLEYDVSHEFISTITKSFPAIRLICSYHDFSNTPDNLDRILTKMQNPLFFTYKIATQAQSTLDALRILQFVQKNSKTHLLTGIAMGELGQCTRILAPVVGSYFNFVSVQNECNVPGQLTVSDAREIYYVQKHNKNTKIFALLGDPVEQSIGHFFHNQKISTLKKNAVYIKLKVHPDELSSVVNITKTLPFSGFSVTMPLKKTIVPLLDEVDLSVLNIGAINTIINNSNTLKGFNTDGFGAFNAVKKHVQTLPSTIILLGAGGTARAIAHAAKNWDMQIFIFNRTLAHAQLLADAVNGQAFSLSELHSIKQYPEALIVNTLPNNVNLFSVIPSVSEGSHQLARDCHGQTLRGLAMTTVSNFFSKNNIVLDCVYFPRETDFLKKAKEIGCICVSGYDMFIEQARLQLALWFPESSQDTA